MGAERNLIYLTEFCQSRALGSPEEIRREHASAVFYLILWKYAKSSSDPITLIFRPQTVVFQWSEYVQLFNHEINGSLTNLELTILFLGLFNLKVIENENNSETISLIKPFPFSVSIEKIKIVHKEFGIQLESSIEIKILGDLKTDDNKKRLSSQRVSIAARKKIFAVLKILKPRVTAKMVDGFMTLFWIMNSDSNPVSSKQKSFRFSKDKLCSIFKIVTTNHPERKEPIFHFVNEVFDFLKIGTIQVDKDAIDIQLSWKKFKASVFFYNPVEKPVLNTGKLDDFTFSPVYPSSEILAQKLQKVLNLNFYDDTKNAESLLVVNQFYAHLTDFLNEYFSKIQETASSGFETERIWSMLKEKNFSIEANSSIFSFNRKIYRKKNRLFQGKVDASKRTVPLLNMQKDVKEAFWSVFSASTGYRVMNLDMGAAHPNIGIGFQKFPGPLNWETEIENFKLLFGVEIERALFKEIIISTYNGKLWDLRNLVEKGLSSEQRQAMLKYFEREKFPVHGINFCNYSKKREYFLGENFADIKVRVKAKASFILSTIECLLTTSLLLDLVKNKNYLLSWEQDGLFFTGELPNNLSNYNLASEKLLNFRVLLKVVEMK